MKKNKQEKLPPLRLFFTKHGSDVECMHYDDYIAFRLSKADHAIFMRYMTERSESFNWFNLGDSMDKAWFAITIGIIRKLSIKFMDTSKSVLCHLNYAEAAVLNRMVKIIQIEIGEENEDQQMFQSIAQELYQLL